MSGRYQGLPDHELVARFYDGADDAFEALAERWRPRLFGFFKRWPFSPQECEELCQETLLALLVTRDRTEGHGRFDPTQPLPPFLFMVARNLARQTLRVKNRGPECISLDEDLDVGTDERSASDVMLADLYACMWSLPDADREYVALCGKHGLGELSHNDIAALMSKQASQITRISHRALKHLRECMEGKGY